MIINTGKHSATGKQLITQNATDAHCTFVPPRTIVSSQSRQKMGDHTFLLYNFDKVSKDRLCLRISKERINQ